MNFTCWALKHEMALSWLLCHKNTKSKGNSFSTTLNFWESKMALVFPFKRAFLLMDKKKFSKFGSKQIFGPQHFLAHNFWQKKFVQKMLAQKKFCPKYYCPTNFLSKYFGSKKSWIWLNIKEFCSTPFSSAFWSMDKNLADFQQTP